MDTKQQRLDKCWTGVSSFFKIGRVEREQVLPAAVVGHRNGLALLTAFVTICILMFVKVLEELLVCGRHLGRLKAFLIPLHHVPDVPVGHNRSEMI